MGRPPLRHGRKTKTNLLIEETAWQQLCRIVPNSTERNNLATKWTRAYISDPDCDTANATLRERLLSQAPLAIKLLNHLEATNAPEELIEELESLLIARASDEVRIESGFEIPDRSGWIV